MVVRQFAVLGTPSFTTWVSCQATIVSDSTTDLVVTFSNCCDSMEWLDNDR